jgi:hypothetical protein
MITVRELRHGKLVSISGRTGLWSKVDYNRTLKKYRFGVCVGNQKERSYGPMFLDGDQRLMEPNLTDWTMFYRTVD